MRKLLLLSVFQLSLVFAHAQYLEVGGFAGVSFYSGDLQHQMLELKESNMAYGFFSRYNFTHRLSAKVHYYKGQISGKDQNSSARAGRNLHFQSDVQELGLQGEFNIMPKSWDYSDKVAIYVFGGISGFMFNPQAVLDDEWTDLQPLGTEGQGSAQYPERNKYSLHQLAIPMGIGLKIFTNEFTNVGIEMGVRRTFTDYLDDVSTNYPDLGALAETNPTAAALSYRGPVSKAAQRSGGQRGNSEVNDMYFFSGVTFSFNLFGYSTTTSEYLGIF